VSYKIREDVFKTLTQASSDSIKARVLCDSINPNGVRLTTMEWVYPRFIHSELLTHRQFSKNSASSRAIPMTKMIERIEENPVFPLHWGKNEKGMQANEELSLEQKLEAAGEWIQARNYAIERARALNHIGIHKQLGNRLVEPWMWITIIISGTNWENLFALRCHPDAEPHFQNLAYKARDAYDKSTPSQMEWGDWHLPLVRGYEEIVKQEADDVYKIKSEPDLFFTSQGLAHISAGRCARVSYLTHEGKRNAEEDIALYQRLSTHKPMHASPLEHPAQAVNPLYWRSNTEGPIYDWGNYDPGWLQLRKCLKGECINERVK
jgi:thymidylate synthase ThyX